MQTPFDSDDGSELTVLSQMRNVIVFLLATVRAHDKKDQVLASLYLVVQACFIEILEREQIARDVMLQRLDAQRFSSKLSSHHN